jgi:hypothetical protein
VRGFTPVRSAVQQEASLADGSDNGKGNLDDHCQCDGQASGIDGWCIGELLARAGHHPKHIGKPIPDR